MPLKKRAVHDALLSKFGFVEVEGSKHEAMALFVAGKKVATTRFSRGYQELSDAILGQIAKQVGVNLAILKRMMDCTVGRDEYLHLLQQRHPDRFQ